MEDEALKYLPVQNDNYLHFVSLFHPEGNQNNIN